MVVGLEVLVYIQLTVFIPFSTFEVYDDASTRDITEYNYDRQNMFWNFKIEDILV